MPENYLSTYQFEQHTKMKIRCVCHAGHLIQGVALKYLLVDCPVGARIESNTI